MRVLLFETASLMKKLDMHVVSDCAALIPNKLYTADYLRKWQMYNMLQLIGETELAQQYINDPAHFPVPVLTDQAEAA